MLDTDKAVQDGWIVTCHAEPAYPISRGDDYVFCTEGHSHRVTGTPEAPALATVGYDAIFREVMNAAQRAATAVSDNPASLEYEAVFDARLRLGGFGEYLKASPEASPAAG